MSPEKIRRMTPLPQSEEPYMLMAQINYQLSLDEHLKEPGSSFSKKKHSNSHIESSLRIFAKIELALPER